MTSPLPAVDASAIDNVSDAAYFAFQLDDYQNRYWHVHLGEPKKNHLHNVNYLGRYIKRPPIAESKLRHYFATMMVISSPLPTLTVPTMPIRKSAWMHWEAFGTDPLRCILCCSNMRLAGLTFCYSTAELRGFHQKLALRKWIPC